MSSASNNNTAAVCHLLKLPGELRNRIYDFCTEADFGGHDECNMPFISAVTSRPACFTCPINLGDPASNPPPELRDWADYELQYGEYCECGHDELCELCDPRHENSRSAGTQLTRAQYREAHYTGTHFAPTFLPLTQVCTQIRAEFLPLYEAQNWTRIPIQDLTAYYRTFYTDSGTTGARHGRIILDLGPKLLDK